MPGDSSNININSKGLAQNTFDAIVIGSGITGGWAAKDFCDAGMKTLVLERGRDVKHVKDYPTTTLHPWEMAHRGGRTSQLIKENPIASRCYAFDESTQHFFVKDKEHPYVQEKPFDWIRGYQVGGKSLIWARGTQRWSRFEFERPSRDGYSIEWPISYNELAPWYSHVERFAGISGNKDGLETMPDGEFLPAWELNCPEKTILEKINTNYKDRNAIVGRCAHLTKPNQIHLDQGRAACQARVLCYRGCPFGGYYSSNAGPLPWAEKTGNLTLQPDSVVHSIIYDEQKQKAVGVRVINAKTKQATEYFAKVIFVNAACLNSNLILMNSTSTRFPNGLGNDNGLLGKYIAFHDYRGNISATIDGYLDQYEYGKKPTGAMLPNFRNVRKRDSDFQAGYMIHFSAGRANWRRGNGVDGIGEEFKNALTEPGGWTVYMMMQGETIPDVKNHVRLHDQQKDEWGIPLLVTSVDYGENDDKILKDFHEQGSEMLDKAGCKNINPYNNGRRPGNDIHEMGGVRMGKDPKTSMLNKWCQFHNVKNVFVTDGACMSSVGNQNPSLTFMAMTARAVDYAVGEMKKGNL